MAIIYTDMYKLKPYLKTMKKKNYINSDDFEV